MDRSRKPYMDFFRNFSSKIGLHKERISKNDVPGVPEIYYELSARGRIIKLSSEIEKSTSWKKDDLTGKSVHSFYASSTEGLGFLQSLSRNGKVEDHPLTLLDKSGRRIPFLASALIHYDAIGRPQRVTGLLRNLQGGSASMAIEGSEVQEVIDRLNEGVYQTRRGVFITVNRAMTKIFGYTQSELIGKRASSLAVEKLREHIENIFFEIAKSKKEGSAEVECQHKDGRVLICEIRLSGMGADGTAWGSVSDITRRRQTENRLMEAVQSHKAITDHMHLGAALILPGLKTASLNRQMREWFPQQNIKTDMTCYQSLNFPGKDVPCDNCGALKTLEDGVIRHFERECSSTSGKKLLHISVTPLYDERGRIEGVIELAEDITARRSMERELLQTEKMRAIGQLSGGIAHDFNNCLTPILGFAEMIKSSLPADAPEQSWLDRIVSAGESAAELTGQLLAFTRGRPARMMKMHLDETALEAVKVLKHSFDRRIKIEVNLTAEKPWVLMPSGSLYQAVINLALNARDAMPDGGRLVISSRSAPADPADERQKNSDHWVHLCFQDSGCGMDAETQKRIFEPFYTTKDLKKGTGMGLATVYSNIYNNGGYIEVKSSAGAGSSFTLSFPAVDDDQSIRSEKLPASNGKGRILAVDDEESIRELLEAQLTSLGYEPQFAADGDDAEKILAADSSICAVILDLILPGRHGREVFQILKSIRPEIPILLISGNPMNQEIRTLIELGAASFLHKPFQLNDLSSSIKKLLPAPYDLKV